MTDKELQEFWEWCGWGYASGLGLISPKGEDIVPPIDLNNLEKYAMPKLTETVFKDDRLGDTECSASIVYQGKDYFSFGETLAQALYQAIQKARRNDNG